MDDAKKKENNLKLGTWNMQTLNEKPDKIRQLETIIDDREFNIIALQEMRWLGRGCESRETCNIYYSCHPNKREFGCGFAVSRSIRENVLKFTPVNERIAIIRMKAKSVYITLICVHAPTDITDNDIKYNFYKELERYYDQLPHSDIEIVLGDFNAQIGKENIFGSTAGKYSYHEETRNNGMRLIDFAAAKDMVICSTTFDRPLLEKITWRSPKKTYSQIDHILINRSYALSIFNVKTIFEVNADNTFSDHYLVTGELKTCIAKYIKGNADKKVKFQESEINNFLLKPQDFFQIVEKEVSRSGNNTSIYYADMNKYLTPDMLDTSRNLWNLNNIIEKPDIEEVKKVCSRDVLSSNYSTICQIWNNPNIHESNSQIFNILSMILYERIKSFIEPTIGNYQAGFRTGKSSIHQIFILRQFLEKTRKKNIDSYHLIFNFKVPKLQTLIDGMEYFEIPSTLRSLCEMVLKKTKYFIKHDTDSDNFPQSFRPVDSLFRLLFIISIEQLFQNTNNVIGRGNIYGNNITVLAFVNEILIIGRSVKFLRDSLTKIKKAASKLGISISKGSTKLMASISEKTFEEVKISEDMSNFKEVENFEKTIVFLESAINCNNNVGLEIMRRITLANKCYYLLNSKMRVRNISISQKIDIYQNLIRAELLYACETWILTDNDIVILQDFEKKILSMIYFNRIDPYERYSDSKIIALIKIKRLKWFTYIEKLNTEALVKIAYLKEPTNPNKRGPPGMQWKRQVEADRSKLLDLQRKEKNKDSWEKLIQNRYFTDKL